MPTHRSEPPSSFDPLRLKIPFTKLFELKILTNFPYEILGAYCHGLKNRNIFFLLLLGGLTLKDTKVPAIFTICLGHVMLSRLKTID